MNDSPADDHIGSEEAGNPSRRELSGLISLNVVKEDYEKIIKIQGIMMQRFPNHKWTIKSTVHKIIDMMESSMMAFQALQAVPDAEQP